MRQQGRSQGVFLIYLLNIMWLPQRPGGQCFWEQIAIHFVHGWILNPDPELPSLQLYI